jgi:ribosomal-protein-serine acetyltransferase
MPVQIIDDSLIVQILEPCHVDALFLLTDTNREHLRPWMPWVNSTITAQDTEDFIRSTINNNVNNAGFTAGIFYYSQLCGVIGFHMPDWRVRHVSMGYWLGKDFQGKGIMTKVCQCLINYAFDTWQMNRIEVRADVLNTRSRALAERIGFTQEGILRQIDYIDENYVDHVVYSILASEWLANQENGTIDHN